MADWSKRAARRDWTLYRDADSPLNARMVKRENGNTYAWIPPEGTEAYFLVWPPGEDEPIQLDCTVTDEVISCHVEKETANAIPAGSRIFFYIKTPDTPSGNPQCVTEGRVRRVDPQ